jgi:hypothetical protein
MKTFIVLGMHRSATSLAAKGLALSGVHMGDKLLGSHASNPYGHWEDIDFINFNDGILKAAGGSWRNVPAESDIMRVARDMDKLIEDFVKAKQRESFWGWKDPRTCLTIQCFMPYLINPHFIVCYRNPRDIAASLHRRDGMEIDKGLILARIYNNRIRKFLDQWTN